MELNDLRLDLARRQKKGLHFILASVFIWTLILIAQLVDASLWQQNMLIFVASAALIPFSLLASRLIHVDFQIKDNPLAGLALLALPFQDLSRDVDPDPGRGAGPGRAASQVCPGHLHGRR